MEASEAPLPAPQPAVAHPGALVRVRLGSRDEKGAGDRRLSDQRAPEPSSEQLQEAGQPPPQLPPPPPAPASEQPAACRLRRRLCACLLLAALLAGAAAAVVLVLRQTGKIGSSQDADDDNWQPLSYSVRAREEAATPAFRSSLHPWLLPVERAALGLRTDADVIVIGAGAAGLQAATTLAPKLRVLVLEAQDRVGGRIHSQPFGGGYAELGAQFVWGSDSQMDSMPRRQGNPVTELANVLALERSAVGAGDSYSLLLGPGGAPLSDRQRLRLRRWQDDAAALASGLSANASLADVLRLPQLQERLGGSAANAALLEAALEARLGARHGAPLAALSALYHDNHTALEGADNILLGGYARIPARLAARLGAARLRLGTPAIALNHTDSHAVVVTAGGQALTAQYVICTVPLGVLRAGGLAIAPPLPAATLAALGGLGVGHLEKLWLQFEEIFWEDGGLCGSDDEMAAPCEQIDLLGPSPAAVAAAAAATEANSSGIAWRRFVSLAAHSRRPVLVGLASGESAQRWQALSDAAILASAMAALQAAFPGRAPAQPLAHLVSRWGQDPWARGALSYPAAGGRGPSDRATLAEPPSGSLILAGEAAWVQQPGTVHGAMLSGQEAALRVLDVLAELPTCGSSNGGSGSESGAACVLQDAAAAGQEPLQCECELEAGTL